MYSDFDSILTRLKQNRLWDFPGGVHPDERKSLSNRHDIYSLPLPDRFYVTVKQHIGVEGSVLVKTGDKVLRGDKLSKSMNPFAVPVHAPTSGTVVAVKPHVSTHPSGIAENTVVIEPDGEDTWTSLTPMPNYQSLPKASVVEAICRAGISGMGGAGFPTHLKASPKKDVEFLIINGVECEPYISSDDRLMREHAWQIRQGIDVLNYLLSPKHVIIAIEDNKPEASEAMNVACQETEKYMVCSIPTKYPAGGEKQLVQVLTNREVPQNGLPIDVGVMMQNVGTCFAIADAVFTGKPLTERVVTLTGKALERPMNTWARIGTPVQHLMAQAEYRRKRQKQQRIIIGGPMMGFNAVSDQVPVVKTTNCVLVPDDKELPHPGDEQPCIRCGVCADACPASLLPQQLYWHSKAKEYDKVQEYNLFDCIECGACAFVCPSEIPLVHYYRVAKADIRAEEEEKDKADKARERFEARKARLEREQQEREEKHRAAAEARRKAMENKDSDAKDKIAAALARAKAKKQSEPDTSGDKSSAVAAAVARAKAKREAAQQTPPPVPETAEHYADKQDKVAAAVARAKAKREAAIKAKQASVAQQDTANTRESDAQQEVSKEDKVAAAVVKAKAKRDAARESTGAAKDTDVGGAVPVPESSPEQADKTDKVAAAVAKAKARRDALLREKQHGEQHSDENASPQPTDTKQDKVAAAIAKAKARKAAREQGATENDNKE